MATDILEVITKYCAIYIDDIRLQELATTDQPLYARRMWSYFLPSISLFNLPSNMPLYLLGTLSSPKLVDPTFNAVQYEVVVEQTRDFTIALGSEYEGYELFAGRIQVIDELGNISYEDSNIFTYDSATGNITVTASEAAPIAGGTVFDFDFYTDGYFVNTLTPSIMNILGMCFQVVWQDRFNSDWLSNITKVEDKNFFEQNRANKMRADTERLKELRAKLASEMRRYEQNMYQLSPTNPQYTPPII